VSRPDRAPRLGGDGGQVAGIEALPFGVLIFVVGALLITNLWAVIDTKIAVDAAAREAVGLELRDMRAFDVYRGPQVGEGRKSVAFRVSFQSPERTLSDGDAAELRERIAAELAAQFGAELRTG
jgi:phenylalanyl-tRNA synthetase beta chain